MRLPGHYPITRLKLNYQARGVTASGFVSREIPPMSALEKPGVTTTSDLEEAAGESLPSLKKMAVEDGFIQYMD